MAPPDTGGWPTLLARQAAGRQGVRHAMVTSGPRVLVVDDDDSMREAMEHLLDAAGLEAGAFSSGEDLLAGQACDGAACVVSDLRLPGMTGLELLAELRARGCETPLILITAHDAPGLRERALKAGASAYLTKPFRGTTLLELIRAAADAYKGAGER